MKTIGDERKKNTQIAETQLEGAEELASISISDEEIKEIFKDVPQTPEQLEKMDEQNIEALFALGNLYRDRLDNTRKATETFEDLLKRYPDNKHNLEAMYSLYLLYDDNNDRAKANYYKDQVLTKYPRKSSRANDQKSRICCLYSGYRQTGD